MVEVCINTPLPISKTSEDDFKEYFLKVLDLYKMCRPILYYLGFITSYLLFYRSQLYILRITMFMDITCQWTLLCKMQLMSCHKLLPKFMEIHIVIYR